MGFLIFFTYNPFSYLISLRTRVLIALITKSSNPSPTTDPINMSKFPVNGMEHGVPGIEWNLIEDTEVHIKLTYHFLVQTQFKKTII